MKVGGSVGKRKNFQNNRVLAALLLTLQLDIKTDRADAGDASRRFGQLLFYLIIRGTYINYVFCRLR